MSQPQGKGRATNSDSNKVVPFTEIARQVPSGLASHRRTSLPLQRWRDLIQRITRCQTKFSSLRNDAEATACLKLEKFWDLVNRQDLEIVERVQEGIENPAYRGGRMCFRFEEPLHRFQNMIIDRMVGRVPAGDDETMTRMFPDPS